MPVSRNKLYSLVLIGSVAGYIWLFFNASSNPAENKSVVVCLIKQTTNIPCPTCGSTRSALFITKGEFYSAFITNPFGYIIATILILAPPWVLADWLTNKNSLFQFYQKLEIKLRKPHYAIPLITLVLINWIWNIIKDL